MDFRAVSSSPAWGTAWARGQPQARQADGSRLTVQTPTCACRVSVAAPGSYRVDMTLRPDVRAHREFGEWVAAVEESAREAETLEAWRAGKSASSTVFRGNLRLAVFGDTPVYDVDGKLSADVMDAAGCTALLELQGCWSTEARWGLRWKVVQLKFGREPPALPLEPLVDDEPAAPAAPFAFLNDA